MSNLFIVLRIDGRFADVVLADEIAMYGDISQGRLERLDLADMVVSRQYSMTRVIRYEFEGELQLGDFAIYGLVDTLLRKADPQTMQPISEPDNAPSLGGQPIDNAPSLGGDRRQSNRGHNNPDLPVGILLRDYQEGEKIVPGSIVNMTAYYLPGLMPGVDTRTVIQEIANIPVEHFKAGAYMQAGTIFGVEFSPEYRLVPINGPSGSY